MLEVYIPQQNGLAFPYIPYPVSCGDPLENDCPVEWLSLDDFVSRGGRDSVIYVRIRGESMIDVGLETGDLAVVDRLKQPENGATVLVRLAHSYTIKKFSEIETYNKRRKFYLVPANPKFQKREVLKKDDFEIVGVVTHIVKKI